MSLLDSRRALSTLSQRILAHKPFYMTRPQETATNVNTSSCSYRQTSNIGKGWADSYTSSNQVYVRSLMFFGTYTKLCVFHNITLLITVCMKSLLPVNRHCTGDYSNHQTQNSQNSDTLLRNGSTYIRDILVRLDGKRLKTNWSTLS